MKYLKYAMALCLCLIIFAPAVAANKEEEREGWEKAVLLSERDTRRLNLYLSDEVEQDVRQALEDEKLMPMERHELDRRKRLLSEEARDLEWSMRSIAVYAAQEKAGDAVCA